MSKYLNKTTGIVLLLIILHLLVINKSQFTAWPEMLSYPYFLLKGFKNYHDLINPYPPFLPLLLQFIYGLTGLGLLQLKVLTYLVIVSIDLLIYIICRKFFNKTIAIITLLIYIPLQIVFEGNGLWFDLFITPFYLIIFIFYSLINTSKKDNAFLFLLLGLVMGTAFLIKQTALFLILGIVLYTLIWNPKIITLKKSLLFVLSILFIVSLSFIPSMLDGTTGEYIFWVFQYPYVHIQSHGFAIYPHAKQIAILSVMSLLVIVGFLFNRKDKQVQLLFIILLSSVFFAVPRFSYFHLQTLLPFYALILGAVYINKREIIRTGFVMVSCLFSALVLLLYYPHYINKPPRFYDHKTITDAVFIGSQLKDKGRVFFYNLSSEYIVIGGLIPIAPWADTFPWYLETPGLQNRIVDSLKNQDVNYVVMRKFGSESEYTPGSYVPMVINNYISSNFENVGTVSDSIWILKRKTQ